LRGRTPKNLVASIRQRLHQLSVKERVDFQLLLTRYAVERLLYRLGQFEYRERFVLKGAMLLIAWEGWMPRPTRDVDLGYGRPDETELRSLFEILCHVQVVPDGLSFHPETIQVDDIRQEQAYAGKRVRLHTTLGKARLDVQVDIGFGDVVVPRAVPLNFPTLLELPPPTILAYSKESVVAEKLEALVRFGMANSRMKDFYDLWMIARQLPFDGATLAEAMAATFARRRTRFPLEAPLALTTAFSGDRMKQTQWRAFLQ
jgi:predicted nucleotidyltransferase component of viral defense system